MKSESNFKPPYSLKGKKMNENRILFKTVSNYLSNSLLKKEVSTKPGTRIKFSLKLG